MLTSLADTVRGAFHSVEDMSHSFIREAIVTGVLPPGHRLDVDHIAAMLGVSRMPIRVALRQLESEGLLEMHPHRRARVSALEPRQIRELYELRVVLECYLLRHAVPRLDDAAVQSLEEALSDVAGAQGPAGWHERHRVFYRVLYEPADRPLALEQLEGLRRSLGRYLLLLRVDEREGHDELMLHLRAKDIAAAQRWVEMHLSAVSRRLQVLVEGLR